MKSIKVKISAKDCRILKSHILWYGNVATQLEKHISILAGISAVDRNNNLVIDGKQERIKICDKNETLIKDCEFVYKSFVSENSRTFASWFLGGRNKGDISKAGRKSTKEKTPGQIKHRRLLRFALENLEQNNIIPFKIDTQGIDYLNENATYKWALIKEVHAKLSSYEEQIKSTKDEFDKLSLQLSEYESNLLKSHSSEVISDFKSFVEDCNTHGHRINYKFLSFLKNSNQQFSTTGYWSNKTGTRHRYSIKQEILDSLFKHNSLIDGNSSLLLVDGIETYIELLNKFEYKKETPTYSAITPETCKFLMGNNCVPFRVVQVADQLIWTIKSPLGEKIQFITNHRRFGKGIHFQLENLKITANLKKDSEKEDGTYSISWSTNGKQPFYGRLCEPNIIFRKHKMFVQLPITINKDEKLEQIRGKIRTILNRSYPKKLTNNNDIIACIGEFGRPLKVMGIDLGLRGIADAMLSYDGNSESLLSTDYISGDLSERIAMSNLVKKINKLKNTINITRDFYNVEDPTELYKECDIEEIEYLNSVSKFKSSGIKLFELKHRKNNWSVSNEYNTIRKEFKQIKVNRLVSYDFLNLPFWANTIKQFINLSKSYLWVGMESPKKVGNEVQNAFATSDFFKTYQENYNNVKEDYAKKVANYIVTKAVRKNVDIIAVEQLSSNLGNKDYKTRHDNEMFLMWNCGRIKFHIENMAKDYGILITEVNEFETSQIHYQTQNYAYRDENNSEILWYDENGELKYTHADKNAAINIAVRFLSQHTNIFSYPIIRCKNNSFKFNISEDSKRMAGAIFKEFKTLELDPKLKNITISDDHGNPLNKSRIFKVNGNWIVGKNKKDIYLSVLKTRALNSASAKV